METETAQAVTEETPAGVVVTDCVGTKIVPGQVITYPVREGSNMWINVAVVSEISSRKAIYQPQGYPVLKVDLLSRGNRGRQTWVMTPSRVTVTALSEAEARKRLQPKRDQIAELADRVAQSPAAAVSA